MSLSFRSVSIGWLVSASLLFIFSFQGFAQEDRSSPEFRHRIAGGFPAARQKLDEAIQRAGSYDFNGASQALNSHVEDHNAVVRASAQENCFPTGVCNIWGILSDRRLSRLYEFLSQMDPADAATKAQSLFDEKLQIHVAGWAELCTERAAGREKVIPIEMNVHALRSALFLVACFCDSDVVLKKLDQWDAEMTPAGVQTLLHPRIIPLRTYLLEQGLPNNLFVANVMLICLQRAEKLTPERLATARDLGLPEVKDLPLMAWNAHTGPFDFVAHYGGVKPDSERVLSQFTLTRYFWDVHRAGKPDAQQAVVDYLRGEVSGQPAVKAGTEPTRAE